MAAGEAAVGREMTPPRRSTQPGWRFACAPGALAGGTAAQTGGSELFSDQSPFAVRFEWGERGLEAIGPGSAVLVVVDVLSFCTCVDVAAARGAAVLPYRWRDDTAARYAEEHRA